MSEQDDQEAAEQEAAAHESPEPRQDQPARQHDPVVSGGTGSTREMRDMARRRRDAEEKLQRHLLEAKEKPPAD